MRKQCFSMLLVCVLLLGTVSAQARMYARAAGPASLSPEEEAAALAAGSVTKSPYLDVAFSALEEGNPFLLRYNLLTGSQVRPRFTLGIPYFFGAQDERVFAKEPDYIVLPAWQNSEYYRSGTNYLYGFDCMGYVKWVWKEAAGEKLTTIMNLFSTVKRSLYNEKNPFTGTWQELAEQLQVGDLIALAEPGAHVVMFIGTLRMYGYDETQVPLLAPYLDYPLVIQCGVHPAFGERFQHLIETGLQKYRSASTTDGGVCVALLGVEREAAEALITRQDQESGVFVLPDSTWLTVVPMNRARYTIFR